MEEKLYATIIKSILAEIHGFSFFPFLLCLLHFSFSISSSLRFRVFFKVIHRYRADQFSYMLMRYSMTSTFSSRWHKFHVQQMWNCCDYLVFSFYANPFDSHSNHPLVSIAYKCSDSCHLTWTVANVIHWSRPPFTEKVQFELYNAIILWADASRPDAVHVFHIIK